MAKWTKQALERLMRDIAKTKPKPPAGVPSEPKPQ